MEDKVANEVRRVLDHDQGPGAIRGKRGDEIEHTIMIGVNSFVST